MRDLVRVEFIMSIDSIVANESTVAAIGEVLFRDAVSVDIVSLPCFSKLAIVYIWIKVNILASQATLL
jgi:hypothetical protein